MGKSRSFSIYLLKPGYDPGNALEDDHRLDGEFAAADLPDGASLYVLDSDPYPPWWKGYFGVAANLTQVTKGAFVFLPVGERCFALSFGHVSHNLRETSFEYDFGLRVTLNSLDPKKLKSTDTLDPGAAKRQRTQLPIDADLTLFDFDRDSTILRSLTGKVRDEHKDLFRHATGASNLRISTAVPSAELLPLCEKLLELYGGEQFKTAFPDIQNIAPVRDPGLIQNLNVKLLAALHAKDPDLNITVPEIINYSDALCITFSGAGSGLVYDDVYIGRYYDYLETRGAELADVGVEDLRHHALVLADENGVAKDRYSIFRSLVFDTTLEAAGGSTFHLCEGQWYRIDNDYIARLGTYLDPLWMASDLPAYNHPTEGAYNLAVAASDASVGCLDTENVSPPGQTAVEPCDLLALRDDTAVMYHVKVSTLSNQLSHLFNQGINAIELLRLEAVAMGRLDALIHTKVGAETALALIDRVHAGKVRIVFGIVTRKDPAGLSKNLPLFSRISLLRALKALHVRGVERGYMFIADESDDVGGRKKKRKKKEAAAATAEPAV